MSTLSGLAGIYLVKTAVLARPVQKGRKSKRNDEREDHHWLDIILK